MEGKRYSRRRYEEMGRRRLRQYRAVRHRGMVLHSGWKKSFRMR